MCPHMGQNRLDLQVSKSHCKISISYIFLKSLYQVDKKNLVKFWKYFFWYSSTLETYRDLNRPESIIKPVKQDFEVKTWQKSKESFKHQLQGLRKVWKSEGGGISNLVGMICPPPLSNLVWIRDSKYEYRGSLPYATFGTGKKVALAKNRIRQIDCSNEINST